MRRTTRTILALCFPVVLCGAARAAPPADGLLDEYLAPEIIMREMAGVHFPENAALAGRPLALNGLGLRTRWLAKIYVAALYLEETTSDPARVIASERHMKLVLRFLVPLSKDELAAEIALDAIAPATGELASQLQACRSWLGDVRAEDEIEIAFVPGTGTILLVNGKKKGCLPGVEFSRALLSAWIGPSPIQRSLRDGLLGELPDQ